ncbi:hypothetical protein [Arcicella rigui]|jgi:hypothetical protein|uniref:Uncharacterized protein n=1 Tax=Arcicella rigui TaxID=797020 RepID=A0ABU5QFB3_9BACT|nr:hypothetical protein [Arcicella rigui]MEA5141541.1 hypothetical protein [Arcicella rigui]
MTQVIKKIAHLLFGSLEYGFPVFGEQSRKILSDENLSKQLLFAIDMDKHGKVPPTIQIKEKSYKLVRLGETQSIIQ